MPFLIVLTLCAAVVARAATLPRIGARGRWFVDTSGRVRLFHGLNDVDEAKCRGCQAGGDTYLPKTLLNATIVKELAAMGFNAFRLPMFWAAAAPQEGSFDEEFLQRMVGVVDELAAHGMYGFLDMHQDVLGKPLKEGGYDIVPEWVTNKMVDVQHPFPWPFKEPPATWALGYLTEQSERSFQDIFDNVNGLLDDWANFWRKVAETFAGRTSVLAYELINEPWGGDIYKDPLFLLPGEAGKKNLMPSYNHVAEAIRTVDTETMIMVEPMSGGVLASRGPLSSGFTSGPGGPEFNNRSCFSWHYYCYRTQYRHQETMVSLCDDTTGPHNFGAATEDAKKLDIPTFLTEFGAFRTNTSDPTFQGNRELEWELNEADKTLQSWTFWDMVLVLTGNRKEIEASSIDILVRPFASAIAGVPTKMSFTRATSKFELEFVPDASISEPTEVIVPAMRYPAGYDVRLSEGLTSVDCSDHVGRLCIVAADHITMASVVVLPRISAVV